MKALVGRSSNGWNTCGFIAQLENGRVIQAVEPADLVQQLRAAGVSEIQPSRADDGDWALSAALRRSLIEAWRASEAGRAVKPQHV